MFHGIAAVVYVVLPVVVYLTEGCASEESRSWIAAEAVIYSLKTASGKI